MLLEKTHSTGRITQTQPQCSRASLTLLPPSRLLTSTLCTKPPHCLGNTGSQSPLLRTQLPRPPHPDSQPSSLRPHGHLLACCCPLPPRTPQTPHGSARSPGRSSGRPLLLSTGAHPGVRISACCRASPDVSQDSPRALGPPPSPCPVAVLFLCFPSFSSAASPSTPQSVCTPCSSIGHWGPQSCELLHPGCNANTVLSMSKNTFSQIFLEHQNRPDLLLK